LPQLFDLTSRNSLITLITDIVSEIRRPEAATEELAGMTSADQMKGQLDQFRADFEKLRQEIAKVTWAMRGSWMAR
jgi:hypothetical protein